MKRIQIFVLSAILVLAYFASCLFCLDPGWFGLAVTGLLLLPFSVPRITAILASRSRNPDKPLESIPACQTAIAVHRAVYHWNSPEVGALLQNMLGTCIEAGAQDKAMILAESYAATIRERDEHAKASVLSLMGAAACNAGRIDLADEILEKLETTDNQDSYCLSASIAALSIVLGNHHARAGDFETASDYLLKVMEHAQRAVAIQETKKGKVSRYLSNCEAGDMPIETYMLAVAARLHIFHEKGWESESIALIDEAIDLWTSNHCQTELSGALMKFFIDHQSRLDTKLSGRKTELSQAAKDALVLGAAMTTGFRYSHHSVTDWPIGPICSCGKPAILCRFQRSNGCEFFPARLSNYALCICPNRNPEDRKAIEVTSFDMVIDAAHSKRIGGD